MTAVLGMRLLVNWSDIMYPKLSAAHRHMHMLIVVLLGAQAYSNAHFGRGTAPILISYVGCTGLETHLANCSHYTPYCSQDKVAGVRCQGTAYIYMCFFSVTTQREMTISICSH